MCYREIPSWKSIDSRSEGYCSMATAMVLPRELSSKCDLEPTILRRLNTVPMIRPRINRAKYPSEASVYFDNHKHPLHKKRVTLGVRRIGKGQVQTTNTAGN